MQVWGWLIVYIVGFGLLQLFLYKHFQYREPSPDSAVESPSAPLDRPGSTAASMQNGGSTDSAVRCAHCGARNEAHEMVRYCGTCTEPLR